MDLDAQTFINVLMLLVGGLLSYIANNLASSLKTIREKHDELQSDITALRLHVSDNYMKSSQMLDIRKEILDRFDQLEGKLDKKQDKAP